MKYKTLKTFVGVILYSLFSSYTLIAQSVCPATDVFNTAGLNTYIVPDDAYEVIITLKGADGGNTTLATGGSGATVGAIFPVCPECTVMPGSTIDFYLGGAGGSSTDIGGAGGGGASVAIVDGVAFPILIAGGGAGASESAGGGGESSQYAALQDELGGTQNLSGGGGSGAGSTEIGGTTHPGSNGNFSSGAVATGGAVFPVIMTEPGGDGGRAIGSNVTGQPGGIGGGGAGGNGNDGLINDDIGGGGGGGGYNGGNGAAGQAGGTGGTSYIYQGNLGGVVQTDGGDGTGTLSDGLASICYVTTSSQASCDPTIEHLLNPGFQDYGSIPLVGADKYVVNESICFESWDRIGTGWDNFGGDTPGSLCTEATLSGAMGTLTQTIATVCQSQTVEFCFVIRNTAQGGNTTDITVKLGGLDYFIYDWDGLTSSSYSVGSSIDVVTVTNNITGDLFEEQGAQPGGPYFNSATGYTVCVTDLNYDGMIPAKLEVVGSQTSSVGVYNEVVVEDFTLTYGEMGAPQIQEDSLGLVACVNTYDLTQIEPVSSPGGLILTWKDSDGNPVTDPTSVPNGDYYACYTRAGGNPECQVICDDEVCSDIVTVGCIEDADGDGIPDSVEIGDDPNNPTDTDRDGVPDYLDLDSDNDGIPDNIEAGSDPNNPVDTDGDGVLDYQDLDSDNDGVNDVEESGATDTDGDGLVDGFVDADGDGLHDPIDDQSSPSTDPSVEVNDGTPQNYALDVDGTSGPDYLTIAPGGTDYTPADSDGDGIPDSVDVDQIAGPDNNGDGINDTFQDEFDSDGDGIEDSADPDADGDGIQDVVDANPLEYGDGLPAPITLESFTVKGKNVDAILEWQTVMEENNSHFEVERSVDGRSFALRGKVDGEGNSTVKQSYEYIDEGIGKTHRHLYYRLKQVDFDGKYDYTEVVAITFDGDERTIIIHPNPVSENLFVKVVGSGDVTIDLFDVHGKHILRTAKQTIDITDYDNGAYYVRVFDGENHLIKSEKIIIIK